MADSEDTSSRHKEHISAVVVGHDNAGKSTLIGHLLYKLGRISEDKMEALIEAATDQGEADRAFAFHMDSNKDERARKMTIHNSIEYFDVESYMYSVIDVPGHRDYIKNMIMGTAQADIGILVVPADASFEESIQRGDHKEGKAQGQTRHHARLLHIIGVQQVIVLVNKMDQTSPMPYSNNRYVEVCKKVQDVLGKIGFRPKKIPFIPVSGLKGDNLVDKSENMPWWRPFEVNPRKNVIVKVTTLLDCLNDVVHVPKREPRKPFRMPISSIYKIEGGDIIAGRVEQGMLHIGQKVTFTPGGAVGECVSIQMHRRDQNCAIPGDHAGIKISGLPADNMPQVGFVMSILNEKGDDHPPKEVESFKALVYVQDHPGQLKSRSGADHDVKHGFTPIVHVRTAKNPCQIINIDWKRGKSTHGEYVRNPKFMELGDEAEVEFKPMMDNPMCVQTYEVCKCLGRFAATTSNSVILLGRVKSVKHRDEEN